MKSTEIREWVPGDLSSIEALYPAAFPQEDLLPLVRELLADRSDVLSLVAASNSSVHGHIIFTTGNISGTAERVSLLGPLAVDPRWQRQGIGRALIEYGVARQRESGVKQIHVLGDPAYYGRFGFTPERNIAPPYPLPAAWADAWQSRALADIELPTDAHLMVPTPWQNPALWAS